MSAKRRDKARPTVGSDDLNPGNTSGAGFWDHLRTFVRHRRWAAFGFVVLAAPLVAVTLLTTPVYQATARILVSDESSRKVGLGAVEGGPTDPVLDPRTQLEVVRSRALARAVVAALELWRTPEYATMAANAGSDAERAQALIDPFLGNVSVDLVTDSRLMAISVESLDPAIAAKAANEIARRFIDRDRESRFAAASASAEWLSKRLAEQRQHVSATETALQVYRAQRDALSLSDRQNIVGQKLADLNAAVTKVRTDRFAREAQYEQIAAIKSDPAALESHPLVASNAFVQTLKAQASELIRQDAQLAGRLGPKHPDRLQVSAALETVEGRLQAEIAKVVIGIESSYRAGLAEESSLTRALNSQKSEAFDLDKKGVEYAALEREAVSARQVFDALLQQTKEAALESDVQESPIRIVDEAEVPGGPIRPRKGQGLAAAMVLGLIGAFGSAFGRELVRRRVASPADVESRLGLPLLSLIPRAPAEAKGAVGQLGSLSPLHAESFRRLRANIMLACASNEQPGNVLTVTSAAPGEGKSFVAAHLAVALAAVDQRVVLIDADMRRPRLHTAFDRQRGPGLADVLLGRRSTAEILRPVGQAGLSLVPAGVPSEQASELLSLPAFRKFLEDLRADFDWIVIDSPPVMAVSDATMLAHDASGVLFVTSAEVTLLEAAEAALAELESAGAHIVGAVLNRAPLTSEAFYYSRYYRPEYGAYLTTDDATETPRPEVAART